MGLYAVAFGSRRKGQVHLADVSSDCADTVSKVETIMRQSKIE
jgi:hypothetical protein